MYTIITVPTPSLDKGVAYTRGGGGVHPDVHAILIAQADVDLGGGMILGSDQLACCSALSRDVGIDSKSLFGTQQPCPPPKIDTQKALGLDKGGLG